MQVLLIVYVLILKIELTMNILFFFFGKKVFFIDFKNRYIIINNSNVNHRSIE